MKTIILSSFLFFFSTAGFAALVEPAIKATAPVPATIKTSDTFSLNYLFYNERGRKIAVTSGTVSLYSYLDSGCLTENLKVGEDLDLALSSKGSYNIGTAGIYYLKPRSTGYTGNCVGPLTVNSPSLPVVFEKLDMAKSGVSGSTVGIILSWMNNESILEKNTTSKATVFLSQNQNCASRISSSRVLTVTPKNGTASISVIIPNVSPVYACAYAYSGQTKINAPALELKSSCTPPQIIINGGCSSCPTGTTLISGKCVTTTKDCQINNGTGTSNLDLQTLTWGNCILSNCNIGYHLVSERNACDSDTQACEILNGVGTQSWELGSWGPCILSSCQSGFHPDGNSCVWSEEQCSNSVCTIRVLNCSSGVCRNTTQPASPGTPGATCFRGPLGTSIWANGSWGPCVENRVAACTDSATGLPLPGYHIESGNCANNAQDCSIFLSNISNVNFDNRFQRVHTGYAIGKKYWNQSTGTYSSCNIQSCPTYTHLENGQCLGNLKNARKEGFMGLDGCYYDIWSDTTKTYYKFKLEQYLYGKSSDGRRIATLCPIP